MVIVVFAISLVATLCLSFTLFSSSSSSGCMAVFNLGSLMNSYVEQTVPLTPYMKLFLVEPSADDASFVRRVIDFDHRPLDGGSSMYASDADGHAQVWTARALLYTAMEDMHTFGAHVNQSANDTIDAWLRTIQEQLVTEIEDAHDAVMGPSVLLDYHLAITVTSDVDLDELTQAMKAHSPFGRVSLLQSPPPPANATSAWVHNATLRMDDDPSVAFGQEPHRRYQGAQLLTSTVLAVWQGEAAALYVDLGADRFHGIYKALQYLDDIAKPARANPTAMMTDGPYVAARLGDMQLFDTYRADDAAAIAAAQAANVSLARKMRGWLDPILCFGDSITQYGMSPGGWVSQLAASQVRMRDISNRGIQSSNTNVYTPGSLLRMARDILPPGRSPHAVSLFWGQNDFVENTIGVPLPWYEAQMRLVIHLVRSLWPSSQVAVLTPHLRADASPETTLRVLKYRAATARAAASSPNIHLIDTWSVLMGSQWLSDTTRVTNITVTPEMTSPTYGDQLDPVILAERTPVWLKRMKEVTKDNIHFSPLGDDTLYKAVRPILES
ncbi:hypothetical protein CXG81DRAFT_25948 [Caulochytrium protostelioides]|nr:hypothetical protein CXG81DRAFT_25948 [Caulochytrium protostelioides]|eukprot:RKP01399.1 hypothetical protein CXG81DRAFT_25948 [Caulochytrium protostelioides]